LYARGIADAILEGKNQAMGDLVQELAGDEEFIEVDDEEASAV
jgi:small subunit ribosomal protein S2